LSYIVSEILGADDFELVIDFFVGSFLVEFFFGIADDFA